MKEKVYMIVKPSHPSTYKMSDEQWKEVCKKEGFTAEELSEAVRRNGIGALYSELYVSSLHKDT
jgi:hypothetical protein